jgi:protein TonB
MKAPVKIRDVSPVYPSLAIASHVEGVVVIEAVIGPTGNIVEARVLRSKPLLDEAALAAVRQWRYTPTLLGGVPMSVILTVTVTFALK